MARQDKSIGTELTGKLVSIPKSKGVPEFDAMYIFLPDIPPSAGEDPLGVSPSGGRESGTAGLLVAVTRQSAVVNGLEIRRAP